MKKLVTVIIYVLVYVLFHMSTWIYYVICYSYTPCIHLYIICVQQFKKIILKNERNFHPENKRLAPIRRLSRLNAGSKRPSFK